MLPPWKELARDVQALLITLVVLAFMICYAVVRIAFGSVDQNADVVIHDHYDQVELNHYYADDGKFNFAQLIYWRWCPHSGRYYCHGYSLVNKDFFPQRVHGRWQFLFRGTYDGMGATAHNAAELRRVTADFFVETWTQGLDPELKARERLPMFHRTKLSQPRH